MTGRGEMSACNLKSQHFQQPEGAPAFLRTPLPPQPPPTGATPPERKKRTDVPVTRCLSTTCARALSPPPRRGSAQTRDGRQPTFPPSRSCFPQQQQSRRFTHSIPEFSVSPPLPSSRSIRHIRVDTLDERASLSLSSGPLTIRTSRSNRRS